MRNALAKTLYELAREDERVCVLVADISPAGAMEDFRREFPGRFINVGVAEQAMIGLAAGMAQRGLRPFCYTIATFALFRSYEFIRCDLAYQNLPVTVVGMGAGLSYPTLGGTHQAVDDVAAAVAMPNLSVLVPSDPREVAEAVRWCAARDAGGPVYMRLGKAGEPEIGYFATNGSFPYCVRWVRSSSPAHTTLVISYGPIAGEALRVARRGEADMITISALSPLPACLIEVVQNYRRVVVIEEASGGPLGTLLRAKCLGLDVEVFALPRAFLHGSYQTRTDALAHCGLDSGSIINRLTK